MSTTGISSSLAPSEVRVSEVSLDEISGSPSVQASSTVAAERGKDNGVVDPVQSRGRDPLETETLPGDPASR